MKENFSYLLGLDVGVSSLGWAVTKTDSNGEPTGIVKMGVRIFNPGKPLDTDSNETLAAKRRSYRSIRRVIDRRQKRKRKTYAILQAHGFVSREMSAIEFVGNIDKKIYEKYHLGDSFCKSDTVPYYIRKRALDENLKKDELARVFYNLAQRRGFLSNRKNLAKKEEKEGIVKKDISSLEKSMRDRQARTLGEYLVFANRDAERIRNRYTSRQMYIDEFEAIYESQRKYYPDLLTDHLKKLLYNAIFYQRPLKSTRNLIGFCEYEPKTRRCPWWRLEAQEFRLLQVINSLTVKNEKLNVEQRDKIYKILHTVDKLSMDNLRKLLNINRNDRINYDYAEEKSIPGHRTNARLRDVFCDWEAKSDEERERFLQVLASQDNVEKCQQTAREKLRLSPDIAEKFSEISLEEGHCALSLKALKKLLPHMRKGMTYPEAVKEVYKNFHKPLSVHDSLPPIDIQQAQRMGYDTRVLGSITNPLVRKTLSETRRLVNALIKVYGKPERIFIELAREIGFTKKEQERQLKNEKERENTRKKLQATNHFSTRSPSRTDIDKYRLAEECHWQCPYTGETISIDTLYGPNPEFQIEHIIPLSRSLDNSYANKTLCKNSENQSKRNRTPYEAYDHNQERYRTILQRVKHFQGPFAEKKYRLFSLTDMSEYEDFTERHLNDTRYASKVIMKYLSLLYGGLNVEGRERKIFTTKGQITAYMREYYGLSRVFGEETDAAEKKSSKNRDDHRHHALDALIIALTTPSHIKKLSHYAQKNWNNRPSIKETISPFSTYPKPEDFLTHVSEKLDEIVPVFHYRHRVRGPLHDESFYGHASEEGMVTQRIALQSLKIKDIQFIIDPDIKKSLEDICASLGASLGKNPTEKELMAYLEHNPLMVDGMPVKKVKIKFNLKTTALDNRIVSLNNNHHMEVYALLNEAGDETRWEGKVVSLYEAYGRKRRKEPIICREHGPNTRYKFTLYNHTLIRCTVNSKESLYVIRSIPQSGQISFVKIHDARLKKDIKKAGEFSSALIEPLRTKWRAEKVVVTPVGEIRRSHE